MARLYGVETRVLNQAVQRNIERFPEDFMFRLTKEEAEFLKSQIEILETGKNMSSQFVTTSPQNWVIIDDTLYPCGHSVKDLGKKLSAIMKMDWDPEVVLKEVR